MSVPLNDKNVQEDASTLQLGPGLCGSTRPNPLALVMCTHAPRLLAQSQLNSNPLDLFISDFQTARCLWNSEVAILLEHR